LILKDIFKHTLIVAQSKDLIINLMKIITHLLINLLLISALIISYIFISDDYHSFDNRLRDLLFLNRGTQEDSDMIRIVSIDEESLAELGQWPWERNKISLILQNLSTAGATIIGMDVFFSEQDKSSPKYVMQSTGFDINKYPNLNLLDYDQILAQTFAQTATVLGYMFDLQKARNIEQYPKNNIAILEKGFAQEEFLPLAKGVTLNLNSFHDNALSSGFLNSIPDSSGMLRQVPLLIKYQDVLYTSLSMEIYRLISATQLLKVHYVPTGILSIELIHNQGSSFIHTDKNGFLSLNFLGPQKSFTYIKAKDVYNNSFDHSLVDGKIILFGATSTGLSDLKATPFDHALPGVEIHATAIENLLQQSYLHHPDWADGANITILLCIYLVLSLLYSRLQAHYILVLMVISLCILFYTFDYLLFQQQLVLNLLFPLIAIILLTLNSSAINYFQEYKQRNIIRNSFSQKVSASVVDDILNNKNSNIFIAQEKEISILFSDIRNFTQIAETLDSPLYLIDLLNIYMTPMVDSIMQTQGTVDKFIGDSIMAYWNAPQKVEHHADRAILSALEQINQLEQVNRILLEKYQQSISIGIAINTGKATVGEMGSKGRSDYTVIGDSVNLASRLESLNKVYNSQIIISQFTLSQTHQPYITRELDQVRVRGKTHSVTIYEVLAQGQASKALGQQLEEHNLALNSYYQGKFRQAKEQFSLLASKHPTIYLYTFYIERCQTLLNNPPKKFDGVYTFTTK